MNREQHPERFLRPIIVFIAALSALSPARAGDYLPFSNAPSEARAAARELMAKESGNAIDPASVEVSVVDLNADGSDEVFAYAFAPYFCGKFGCNPRVFQRSPEGYRNIFKDDAGIAQGSPRNIVLVAPGHGGYVDILLGSALFTWDGQNYVEDRGPTRTNLDDVAFLAACEGSSGVAAKIRSNGIDPAKGQDAFCACMVDQFETAGLEQFKLDLYASDVAGRLTEADIKAYGGGSYEAFAGSVADFERGCFIDITVD